MNNFSFYSQPIRTVSVSILMALLSFIVMSLLLSVFGEAHTNIIISNPLISGYLHVSLDHFLYNFTALFLFLIPSINRYYNYRDIYFITLMLSLLYLPFSVTGFFQPAVGISGTCFFLLARILISYKSKILGIFIFMGVLFMEYFTSESNDQTAHFMHYLGAITGYLSLKTRSIIGFSVAPFTERKLGTQNFAIS